MKTDIILHLALSATLALPLGAYAAQYQLTSPDSKTVVTVSDDNGLPVYTLAYDGKEFLKSSPLGLKTNIGDYTSGLVMSSSQAPESVRDAYSLPNIKKSSVEYNANRGVMTFSKDSKPVFDLIMQVSDNNVAMRYRLLPQGETLCCVIDSEATGFAMPDGTTTFLCPQSTPMTGFARTAPSYETNYTLDDTTGKNGWGVGYSFPCLFRNGDNGWMLISETGIAGNYCGAHLTGKDNGVYEIAYAQPGEQN
ncbi:MAG: glycoside hydrolase family 97 N-terminal domain-containing protein, partial [Duncaniella sp.]|nr:glycoside hydrolase family 97 N-terminal domain-containing protein [Duncaniella sp.]